MKVSLDWLAEYVDLSGVPNEKLSEALNLSGTECEIQKSENKSGNIVVGEILDIQKHSNADKLHVCQIDVGEKKPRQIVCGSMFIVKKGNKVPVALAPTILATGIKIKAAQIRGVDSFGMICSDEELGIKNEGTGLTFLDRDVKNGTNINDILIGNNPVLELDITPNRSDCFSVIGIAREAAASLNKKMKSLKVELSVVTEKLSVKVEVKEKELCPRYIARVIKGVKLDDSPKWMQERLIAAGVRPINNIVDVTNYVMLEWGQPMHAFDLAKISHATGSQQANLGSTTGDKNPTIKIQIPEIIVRKARKGEKLKTLDGVERVLDEKDLVIADDKKAIALAGVMGGANSEVGEKTKDIVLEAAVFDGTNVRKTAQRLSLRTEASNRFEKGVPLTLPEIAIERAAKLIMEIPGGLAGQMPIVKPVASENIDVLSKWIWLQRIGMRFTRLNAFIGIDIKEGFVTKTLNALGFEAERFDFKKEARHHVGKPYVFGASYKTHGEMAFDCSYLTDFIYSRIGRFIGHTALAQFELGKSVSEKDLKPGDVLFVKGHMKDSVTDHYFIPDGRGGYTKVQLDVPKEVGHNGIYIGDGRVVHARHYIRDSKGNWKKSKEGKVVEEGVEIFTKDPEFLVARRYIENPADWLAITVPWWRLDVKTEQDIFEEIGRIYGYDNLPSTLPRGDLPIFEENKKLKLEQHLRHILSGVGFTEFFNYSFVSKKVAQLSSFEGEPVRLENPTSPETEYLRSSLAGSMILSASRNQENFDAVVGYEIASVFRAKGRELPDEKPTLGIFIFDRSGKVLPFFKVKGVLELIFAKLNISDPEFQSFPLAYLEKGQAAQISISGKKIGYLGQISAKSRLEYGLKQNVGIAEIDLSALIGLTGAVVKYKTLPRFPRAIRDFNLIFEASITVADIKKGLEGLTVKNLISTLIIDVYKDKASYELLSGGKSVTIRLVLGSNEKTLTEAEITIAQNQVLEFVKNKLRGELRAA